MLIGSSRPRSPDRFGPVRLGLLFATALAVALPLGVPAPAAAQTFGYGWFDGPPPKKKKPKVIRRAPEEEKKTSAVPEKTTAGPVFLSVSLRAQRVHVYDANGLIAEAPISSGRVGNPTPMGVFTVLEKQRIHYSNLYDSAPMPNMNRITWSGVALHAGVLPGYPASHGCIRLPHAFSSRLYKMTSVGSRVIVSRDPVVPRAFSHAKLFTAVPDEADTSASLHHAMASRVADASGNTTPEPVSTQLVTDTPAAGAQEAVVKTNAYREKWKAEMARLAAAIPAAQTAKTDAAAVVPGVAKAADDARAAYKAARADVDQAAKARKKAANALEAADNALAAYVKKMTGPKRPSEEDAVKLVGLEDQLEAGITEATNGLDTATAEVERTQLALKEAEAAAITAETARKAALNTLAQADAELKKAIAADAAAKRREAKRGNPVSVFISLKTQKLYIRQGWEQLLEVPVTIENPEKPIGTHVFTALALADNKTDVKWSVVSIPTLPAAQKADLDRKKKKAKDEQPVAPVAFDIEDQKPDKALDRITIPDDVREQISDVMKPGSSLLISDYGMSGETGQYTDFIVSLR